MTNENTPARGRGKSAGRQARPAAADATGRAPSGRRKRGARAAESSPRAYTPRAATITVELSKQQVDQVVRAAGQGGAMSVLLSALKDPNWSLVGDGEPWSQPAQMEDRRLSRSLLSGLLVLSCFPADGGYLGIADLARMLAMNTSTTHRYVTTLLAVGLLERDANTRRYRLAPP
jgi:hypothetical protein